MGGCGDEKRLAATRDSGSSDADRPNRAAGDAGDIGESAGERALLLPSLELALSDLLLISM